MPEYIIVISDPRVRKLQALPVKVVGLEDLEYNEKHKEQKVLPVVKMSPKLIDIIKPELGVVVIRIWKNRAAKEKISLTAKVAEDPTMDTMTVGIPLAFLTEKLGTGQAIGEVFRAPSFQVRISDPAASRFVGLKIGDKIDGRVIGFPNMVLEIKGGSDLAGFPMRPDIDGAAKKYILLSAGPGFRPREKGERRRKLVRGNTISPELVQINTVVVVQQ